MSDLQEDAERLAAYALKNLSLETFVLDKEFEYASLSLCVIDAVYSIGVNYKGVQNVVARYCDRYGLQRAVGEPGTGKVEFLSALCERFESVGVEAMAKDVFQNMQRTSATGGILKAGAVYRFAKTLRAHGVEDLSTARRHESDETLESDLTKIPGQRISIKYFWMLAGTDSLVKPDRMIQRFTEAGLGRDVKIPRFSRYLQQRSPV